MPENKTEIIIRMDEHDEIELILEGLPINLATALVCGLSKAAAEIYPKLPEPSQRVFAEEIAELACALDPENEEDEE